MKYSKMESWKSGSFRPADRHTQVYHPSPNSRTQTLRDSRWSHLYQSGCGSPPSPSSGSPSARPSPCSSPQSPSAYCTQTQRQVRRGRGEGEGARLRLSLFDLSPLQVDVGSLDLTQLLLNQLFGSDLRIQRRLQLQPGRHVQLLAATHLPQRVLQGSTKSQHPSSVQRPFCFCAHVDVALHRSQQVSRYASGRPYVEDLSLQVATDGAASQSEQPINSDE